MALGPAFLVMGCAGGSAARSAPPVAAPTTYTRSTSPGEAALAFARAQLGKPYCWGGSGARCFDCSGLTQAAWRAAGRRIPRTSADQARELPEVALSRLRPGDILWRPGHVGLYAGDGRVIAATETGDVIRYQRASAFKRAVRP